MAELERIVEAPIEQVWAVLADGWSYSDWVVGNAHVRDVDDTWPQLGARLHHQVGAWPVLVADVAVVEEAEPPRRLVLRAELRRLGRGRITLELTPLATDRTRITMEEHFEAGPARWVMVRLNDLVLHRRNAEGLRRVSELATRRYSLEHMGTSSG